MPPPDDGWCDEATEWYESLAESAQAIYYEPSDWQVARIVAQELTDYLSLAPEQRGASKLRVITQTMDKLLVTHGSRMRAHIEVAREGSNEEKAQRQDRAARRAEMRAAERGDNGDDGQS